MASRIPERSLFQVQVCSPCQSLLSVVSLLTRYLRIEVNLGVSFLVQLPVQVELPGNPLVLRAILVEKLLNPVQGSLEPVVLDG